MTRPDGQAGEFRVCIGPYELNCVPDGLPSRFDEYTKHAALADCIAHRGIAEAIAGDGASLAQAFAEWHVSYSFMPELLFGILPRVTQHRAELADALRLYRDERDTYSSDNVPFRLLARLAEYRDLARLAGDREEASRLQAIIARHARVLADRDRLIAFALLE